MKHVSWLVTMLANHHQPLYHQTCGVWDSHSAVARFWSRRRRPAGRGAWMMTSGGSRPPGTMDYLMPFERLGWLHDHLLALKKHHVSTNLEILSAFGMAVPYIQ